MIRSLLLLSFLLALTQLASAKSRTLPWDGAEPVSYLAYYQAVAQAEAAIMEGNYPSAIRQYQSTFDAYPYNNPIDCYVAAQLASYAGDSAACRSFICKGLCFGLPVPTIRHNPYLLSCFGRMAQPLVDSCLALYRAGIDTAARARMLSLITYDQAIVRKLGPAESIYEPDGYTLAESYRPIWDSLLQAVIALTRSSGFPAQKIIGTQTGEDSLFQIGPNAVFAAYIFIHHSNGWPLAKDLLWPELLKGNITPQMYGVLYECSNGSTAKFSTPVLYFASRYCQEPGCKKIVKERLKEINAARWQIGLCSYEVMEWKFKSRKQYFKWRQSGTAAQEPAFDFQCDLNFQGRG